VFQLSGMELLRFEHSHGKDDWHRMHEVTSAHDSAASDPERKWDRGDRIFRCDSCAEEIRIVSPEDATPE
jgi:hypothetical protein